MMKIINTFKNGINHMRVDLSDFIKSLPNAQRNTELLEQRNATICTNLECDNMSYMPLEFEHCPNCNKKTSKTIRQEEFPYVRHES